MFLSRREFEEIKRIVETKAIALLAESIQCMTDAKDHPKMTDKAVDLIAKSHKYQHFLDVLKELSDATEPPQTLQNITLTPN